MVGVRTTSGSLFVLTALFVSVVPHPTRLQTPGNLRQYKWDDSRDRDPLSVSTVNNLSTKNLVALQSSNCPESSNCPQTQQADTTRTLPSASDRRQDIYEEMSGLIALLRGAHDIKEHQNLPTQLMVRQTRSEPTYWLGTHAAGTAWDAYIRMLRQQQIEGSMEQQRSSNPVNFLG